jgi:predicted O-methyltransferase YrrM
MIVELGTWKGGSALHMCDLADRLGLSGVVVVCVDTWLGNSWHWMESRLPESFPSLNCRHGFPHIYLQFLANVLRTGHADKVVPLPNTTDVAAEIFREVGGGPIDLLYVDANHTEQAVSSDLAQWWPMVRPGGIVFGDDFIADYPGVEQAVRRFCREQRLEVEVEREKWILRKPAWS